MDSLADFQAPSVPNAAEAVPPAALPDVDAAFDQAGERLDELLDALRAQGVDSFEQRQYQAAQKLGALAGEAEALREHLRALRESFHSPESFVSVGRRPRNLLASVSSIVRGTGVERAFAPVPLVLAACICLLLGQLIIAQTRGPDGPTLLVPALLLHAAALGLGVFGARVRRSQANELAIDRSQPLPVFPLVVILTAAALLRLLWLGSFPFRVDGDAAAFARGAYDFVRPNPPPLIGTGWMSHTNLYFFFESLVLRFFGPSMLGTRIFSALGGIGGVGAVFLLGRSLFGTRAGLMAGVCTAVLPFGLVFSRIGTEVIHLTWLVPLVILMLWEGWRDGRRGLLIVGGIVAGLSQYFYPGARLVPILCVVQLGLLTIFVPRQPYSWWRGLAALGWTALGALIIYAPMMVYYLYHLDIYTARVSTVSIFSSGWLSDQLAQRPWWDVWRTQILNAFFPFLYPVRGSAMWWMWPQYLGPLDAALFALGLLSLWASRQAQLWVRLFFAFYLVVGFVLAGVVTVDSPMPSRYVIFLPVVALCIGLGAEQLLRAVGEGMRPAVRRRLSWIVPVALLGYSLVNVNAYIDHDKDATWLFAQPNQVASFAARYLEVMPKTNYQIVYLETSENYFEANPALAFLSQRPGVNIPEGATCGDVAGNLQPGENVVIAPMTRIPELKELHGRIPEAQVDIFSDPGNTEMVAIMRVRVPQEGLFSRLCDQ